MDGFTQLSFCFHARRLTEMAKGDYAGVKSMELFKPAS